MLTSQDLKLIEELFIKFEEKLSKKFDFKLDSLESRITRNFDFKLEHIKTHLTNKIDERADQIIEYINPTLDNHERRITKIEDSSSYLIRDQKKE